MCWELSANFFSEADVAVEWAMRWLMPADWKRQDDPEMSELLSIVPILVRFIVAVYALGSGVFVHREAVKRVFYFLPFPPEVKDGNGLMKHILALIFKPEFAFLKNKACVVFAEVFSLQPEDIWGLGFEYDTLLAMRYQAKRILTEEPERIERVRARLSATARDQQGLERILS
jgi:hypothetical protein